MNRIDFNSDGTLLACAVSHNYDDIMQYEGKDDSRQIAKDAIVIREIKIEWIIYI